MREVFSWKPRDMPYSDVEQRSCARWQRLSAIVMVQKKVAIGSPELRNRSRAVWVRAGSARLGNKIGGRRTKNTVLINVVPSVGDWVLLFTR
jgi:hypothetical protein